MEEKRVEQKSPPKKGYRDRALQARYERYRGVLKELTIMSDMFMRNVLKKQACTEYVLQVIMERKDLRVVEQVLQQDYKNLQGRSAILDCVARDREGKLFNVELQQGKEGASPKRARYHSGLLDMNTLNPGEDFEELPESHVIFITPEDVLGDDLPIYHIGRRIDETGAEFGDEFHITYVNGGRREEDTELGRLMEDFHCKDPKDIHSEILAERVRELKETQEGVEYMCKEMDKIYSEGEQRGEKRGMARGLAEGEMRAKKDTAFILADRGMSISDIAEIIKVSAKVVEEWLSGNVNLAK